MNRHALKHVLKPFLAFALVLTLVLVPMGNGYAKTQTVENITIYLGDQIVELEYPIYQVNERVFVPVRFFLDAFDAKVEWDSSKKEVFIETPDGETVKFFIDQKIVEWNGIEYISDVAPFIMHERTYLPLRHVSELLHSKINWDNATKTATITPTEFVTLEEYDSVKQIAQVFGLSLDQLLYRNGYESETEVSEEDELRVVYPLLMENPIDQEELDLLARIIYLEAGYEPYEGQIAVGNVILNRVASSRFPNSIYDVLFQPGQFPPASSGRIYEITPSEAAYQAAREALSGKDVIGGAAYYFNNVNRITGFFQTLTPVKDIGNHRFMR